MEAKMPNLVRHPKRPIVLKEQTALVCCLVALAVIAGCREQLTETTTTKTREARSATGQGGDKSPRSKKLDLQSPTPNPQPPQGRSAAEQSGDESPHSKDRDLQSPKPQPLTPNPQTPTAASPLPVDDDRIAAHGIRKIEGNRLMLYTDLPVDETIDGLPSLFEQAVPLWCDYFHIDPDKLSGWHVRGCLTKDKAAFTAAGLLPRELPYFGNGFTRDSRIWWLEQASEYYRNHLLLHEGTHSFMYAAFGTCGPPWYMEAMAELLGTHHLAEDHLVLGYFPASRDELPYWGRLTIVTDRVRSGHALSIDQIMDFGADANLRNETYGWCWAIAAFLDGHPRYCERFRELPGKLTAPDFNRQFRALFADDWRELNQEWQAFIHDLDYGYDLVRGAIEFRASESLDAGEKTVTIAADRGWQSSGIRLELGSDYQVTATGRYQVAAQPKIWWCEPDGVTIRYVRGQPLGRLLATIVPDGDAAWPGPIPIGVAKTVSPKQSGTLYFKINDSPAELSDNAGALEVTVARTQP
jgi:hypothetical protein